ncbi:hypothetical protein BsWGS_17768 [Bradybaena similaris]
MAESPSSMPIGSPTGTNLSPSAPRSLADIGIEMDASDGMKRLVGVTTDYQHINNQDDPTPNQGPPSAIENVGNILGSHHSRLIFINGSQRQKFCSNKISTAKYSLFTFLPKFLFEQFRKYANIFFLFIALLQQIPNVSPTGRYTTAVPLLLILMVSAIKEIVEDIKRHRADGTVNNIEVSVHRHGRWQEVKWQDVVVGDIVKIVDGAHFPADLILLSSSEPQAMCYIETSNLDGETNLKLRQGSSMTASIVTGESLSELRGVVECEHPNRFLYEFVGNIRIGTKRPVPLGPDQILLRGACLKNTSWIYGLVIYTGKQSKLMLNSTTTPLKRSNVEKKTNSQILLLFLLLVLLSLVCAIASHVWVQENQETHWYLFYHELTKSNFGYNLLTFIILFNNLIPISLQVTLEMVKFIQAIFINWDQDMYYSRTQTPANARTSNLNEELGQIKFIFSDKTGTLTQNIMRFSKCSIAGIVYGENEESAECFNDESVVLNLRTGHPTAPIISEFLTLMAVCHTVVPQINHSTGEIQYLASSPDEAALVSASKQMQHVFTTRTPDYVIVDVLGILKKYQVLNVLEFTSKRKRMSVIVRTPEKKIILYCKGADNVIYERLGSNKAFTDETVAHLEQFAATGLRTLCFAMAEISEETYKDWADTYYKASTAIVEREQKLEEAAELIEKDLRLLGATAIEDRLQDGVPETIDTLAKADIKIWVLTGDKQETAINIGYSCKLLNQGMDLIVVNEDSLDSTRDTLVRHKTQFGEQLGKENYVGFIIDGQSLKYALTCDCRQDFLDIALSCRAVICCRVSPLQKAELVDLVKVSQNAITLAIGDGANDVGMIQAAHVGVGISGEEGLQAACASDYSIAQFRFLQKLLLVHGAWSYSRICKLILYSFYKNICLYVIQFWFQLWNGYSGQIIYERWTLGLYNVIFTAAPPLAMGLFDRYCSAETMMKNPVLYKDSQTGRLFSFRVFWFWIMNAVFHSVVLFWMTIASLQQDVAFSDGKVGDYLFMGNFVYTYVVVTVCLKAGLETIAWTWLTHLAIWGSIACWFLFLIIYSHVYPLTGLAAEMVGMDRYVYGCSLFWLGLIIIPCSALLRDFVWKVIRREFFKTHRQSVQELELAHKEVKIELTLKKKLSKYRTIEGSLPISERARLISRTFMMNIGDRMLGTRRPTTSSQETPDVVAHGFAFSQEEHGVVNQTQYIRAYDTTQEKPEGY